MKRVRIVKVDSMNYAVQEFRLIESKERKAKDGTVIPAKSREDWIDAGYYGNHLDWAAKSALMAAVPDGAELLGEFNAAADRIVAELRKGAK